MTDALLGDTGRTRRKVLIIAEAGVNHDGCMKKAKHLVDIAAQAQVDVIKFQTFKAASLVTKTAAKAAYQLLQDELQLGSPKETSSKEPSIKEQVLKSQASLKCSKGLS